MLPCTITGLLRHWIYKLSGEQWEGVCRKFILRNMKKFLKFRRKKRTDGFFSKYCCFTSPWLCKGKDFLPKIVAGLKRYQFIWGYKMRCELLKKATHTVFARKQPAYHTRRPGVNLVVNTGYMPWEKDLSSRILQWWGANLVAAPPTTYWAQKYCYSSSTSSLAVCLGLLVNNPCKPERFARFPSKRHLPDSRLLPSE